MPSENSNIHVNLLNSLEWNKERTLSRKFRLRSQIYLLLELCAEVFLTTLCTVAWKDRVPPEKAPRRSTASRMERRDLSWLSDAWAETVLKHEEGGVMVDERGFCWASLAFFAAGQLSVGILGFSIQGHDHVICTSFPTKLLSHWVGLCENESCSLGPGVKSSQNSGEIITVPRDPRDNLCLNRKIILLVIS